MNELMKKAQQAKQATHILNYVGAYDSECIVKKEDGGFSLAVNNPEILAHGKRWLFDEEGYIIPVHICSVVEDIDMVMEMALEDAINELYECAKESEEELSHEMYWRMYDELKVFEGAFDKVYFDCGDYHVVNEKDEVVYTVEM